MINELENYGSTLSFKLSPIRDVQIDDGIRYGPYTYRVRKVTQNMLKGITGVECEKFFDWPDTPYPMEWELDLNDIWLRGAKK